MIFQYFCKIFVPRSEEPPLAKLKTFFFGVERDVGLYPVEQSCHIVSSNLILD